MVFFSPSLFKPWHWTCLTRPWNKPSRTLKQVYTNLTFSQTFFISPLCSLTDFGLMEVQHVRAHYWLSGWVGTASLVYIRSKRALLEQLHRDWWWEYGPVSAYWCLLFLQVGNIWKRLEDIYCVHLPTPILFVTRFLVFLSFPNLASSPHSFFSHLLTLPFSHVNMPVITISCASVAPCVCAQIARCKAIRLSEWFPSVNKSRAGDRKAAMGIWLIHSAHFVNSNRKGSKEGEEHERGANRGMKEGWVIWVDWKQRKPLRSQPMSRPGQPTHKQFMCTFTLHSAALGS